MTNTTQEIKLIAEYGLVQFCKEIEKALKEGFSFDFDTNERVPNSYGSLYECTLVKSEIQTVEGTSKKQGRPAKVEVK